ncbi:MAG: GGDEF domain-containing protein [Lachnospiraceae bacterium]|nr:GGDEF domain-containing protein [Lachnospiraceae bacterium]
MTIERIRELLADKDRLVTGYEITEASVFFEADADADCRYIKEFLDYYDNVSRYLGLLHMGALHSCTQKYAARMEDNTDGADEWLPYLYLKEMDFYTALHSYSESFRFINLILDLDNAPDFCVAAALMQALDLFMACGLKGEAEQYVDRTRTFALLCDLPDTYKMILDCNLMQGYAFIGDLEKYRFYRKRIYSYDDALYDGPLETALRIFCLGSKALLGQDTRPEETDIAEFEDLFGGNLTTYGIFVDYPSIIVPIFRWIKGCVPDEKLTEYALKMIDVSASISDKLDLYAFLMDEVILDPERLVEIHGEYHETLRRYYDNSLENHRYEVLGELVSHEIGRQYKKDSLTDRLTETGNRYAYERALDRIPTEDGIPSDVELVVFMMDVNGLKRVNDTYGHAAGDAYIKGAAKAIEETIGQYGAYFRTGGDEFAALWMDVQADAMQVVSALKERVSEYKDDHGNVLSIAIGVASSKDYPACTVPEIVKKADEAMYADKRDFYARSGMDRRARV